MLEEIEIEVLKKEINKNVRRLNLFLPVLALFTLVSLLLPDLFSKSPQEITVGYCCRQAFAIAFLNALIVLTAASILADSKETRSLIARVCFFSTAAITGITILLAYAEFYMAAGLSVPNERLPVHSLGYSIYFSATTWSTVGFGDVTPVNPACRAAAALEALNGYFVLGLLIASLVPVLVRLTQSYEAGLPRLIASRLEPALDRWERRLKQGEEDAGSEGNSTCDKAALNRKNRDTLD